MDVTWVEPIGRLAVRQRLGYDSPQKGKDPGLLAKAKRLPIFSHLGGSDNPFPLFLVKPASFAAHGQPR